jgi:hypothetical protein
MIGWMLQDLAKKEPGWGGENPAGSITSKILRWRQASGF